MQAAKRGCVVLGNDLNPVSYEYLVQNINLNKLRSNATAFNLCGREFVRQLASGLIGPPAAASGYQTDGASIPFDHVVMNLPASAPEFADAFIGLGILGAQRWPEERLPAVHCYCFARCANYTAAHINAWIDSHGANLDAIAEEQTQRSAATKSPAG